MDKLGFADGSPGFLDRVPITHNSERHMATYRSDGKLGHQLAIVDKHTKQWLKMGYSNDEVFHVTHADLSHEDLDELFETPEIVGHEYSVRALDVPLTIFASRPDKLAINYTVSKQDARTELGIPEHGQDKQIFRPNIRLWSGGKIEIPENGPLGWVKDSDPKVFERIRQRVRFDVSGNDLWLRIGNKEIRLVNPDEEMEKIINSQI